MNTGTASGPGVFNQKFYFLDNGSKKEVEFDPINVNFDPSGATSVASLGGSATPANPSTEPKATISTSAETPNTTSSNTASETPVANTETKTTTSTPTETKTTSSEPVTTKTTPTETKTTPTETKTTPTETKTTNNTSSNTTPVTVAKTTNADGLVYKVQISASATDPGKEKFASAGKVVISNEGGMYKVLVGSFNSKEEAIEKMNQLKGSGFNGFVVKYQNGVRVK